MVQYWFNTQNYDFTCSLYGFEIWSLPVTEEYRLGVFESRVQRTIFGPKRNGVWRNLHNEELHNLYSSPSVTRMTKGSRIRGVWHVARRWRRQIHVGFLWESQKERDH
jgi:hypothetical protein